MRDLGLAVLILVAGAALVVLRPEFAATLGALLVLVLAVALVRVWLQYHRLAFRVEPDGRDAIRYVEKRGQGTGSREIVFDGEMVVGGRHIVYIPNEAAWRSAVPPWARDRRTEIVRRLESRLSPKRYQFDEQPE